MTGRVKGVLFVDYVKMLRARHDASLSKHLQPVDLRFLEQTIDPAAWYPMDTFERLGLAILHSVAGGDLDLVRQWGLASVGHVARTVDGIIVPGDPRESLMRLHVFRRSFFDFEAVRVQQIDDVSADIQIQYGMSPLAEEAAAVQTLGFFEGLLELAEGNAVTAAFSEQSWRGDPRTLLRLSWRSPLQP